MVPYLEWQLDLRVPEISQLLQLDTLCLLNERLRSAFSRTAVALGTTLCVWLEHLSRVTAIVNYTLLRHIIDFPLYFAVMESAWNIRCRNYITGWTTWESRFDSRYGQRFFSIPAFPDRFWSQSSLISRLRCQELNLPRLKTAHSFSSGIRIKNE